MPASTLADTMALARRLKELCEAQDNLRAIDELYHPGVVSVEAWAPPGAPDERETLGIDAVRAKNRAWLDANEVHERTIDAPFPHAPDRFALAIRYEVTPKRGPMAGRRLTFREIGVYTVRDGKIGREEYFYAPPDA